MPHAGLCHCWGSRVLPLLLAYICYLLLGTTVFQMLEKQAEAQSRDQFQFEKLRFLENYTCLDQQALEQFVQVIMAAWVKGANPKGDSINPSKRDFGSSFFFAGTVVPTIAYGNLAPSTEAGQVFCVSYALVGIPLNVIFLNHLGTGLRGHLTTLERREDQPRHFQGIVHAYQSGDIVLGNSTSMGRWELMGSFFFSVSTITTIGYGNLSPHTMAARLFCIFFALVGIPLNLVVLNHLGHLMEQGVHRCARRLGGAWQDPAKARWLAGSGALLSGLLLFLLLPPLLFSHMEGWSYVEGFYYAFITLSTVGFGDYVIGMDPSRRYPLWYKNTVSLWILFGMAWLALIIKLILSLMETPGRSYSCYHHSCKGDFKPRGWRQGPGEEAEPHSPQPGCHPERSVETTQHPEPSTHVSCCGEDS